MGFGLSGGALAYYQRLISTIGAALLRYYRMNDLSGTAAIDSSLHAVNGVYVGGPTLGEAGFDRNGKSVLFGANTGLNIYNASLVSGFTPNEVSIGMLFQAPNAGWWTDNAQHQLWHLESNASNTLSLQKNTSNQLTASNVAGGTSKGLAFDDKFTTLYSVIITLSKSNDRFRIYQNGSKINESTGLGSWTGNLGATTTVVGTYYSDSPTLSALVHAAHFWIATRELTQAEVGIVSNPFDNNSVTQFFAIGDSKTANSPNWVDYLVDLMGQNNRRIVANPARYALGGWTTQNVTDGIDAALTARSDTPAWVGSNLGANDINGADPGVTWKNNTEYIALACRTKWGCPFYQSKIWRRCDANQAANLVSINSSIDALVAKYPDWFRVGVNEASYLPGSDDGATYTSDGVHPNAAGAALLATGWKAVLGY